MANKQLRRMSRTKLIEIIYALQQNEQQLRAQLEDLESQLEDRIIRLSESGSIAEAALSLNHVFEDADQASQQYLDSVMSGERPPQPWVAVDSDADVEVDVLGRAWMEADQLLRDTWAECDRERAEVARERERFLKEVSEVIQAYPELAAAMYQRRCSEESKV